MAALVTGTAIGNTLTRIGFSSILHRQTQDKLYFNQRGLIAKDSGGESAFDRKGGLPIRSVEALNNRRAQEVRIGMINQLTRNRTAVTGPRTGINARTYGVATANQMEGQEEAASLRSCIVFVEQSKHATTTVTPEVQDLRTEFKITAQFAGLLTDWMAAEDEDNYLDAFYDQYSGHVVAGLSQTAADPPALNMRFAGGVADNASLGAGNTLTPAELRRMWMWIEDNNINPIRTEKGDCYVLLVHPFCYADLMGNTEFQNLYKDGWDRGSKNPIFGMADAKYMNIYIHAYKRIRASATNANARKCLLLGADCVAQGTTVRPRLVRLAESNYEDIYGIGIKSVWGAARFDWAPTSGTTINQSMAVWGIFTAATV